MKYLFMESDSWRKFYPGPQYTPQKLYVKAQGSKAGKGRQCHLLSHSRCGPGLGGFVWASAFGLSPGEAVGTVILQRPRDWFPRSSVTRWQSRVGWLLSPRAFQRKNAVLLIELEDEKEKRWVKGAITFFFWKIYLCIKPHPVFLSLNQIPPPLFPFSQLPARNDLSILTIS